MRWPSASLAACSCALALAACGGQERTSLPAGYALRAAARADRIAALSRAKRPCAAAAVAVRLQRTTIRAINDRSIPAELQEELLGRVTALAAVIPCRASAPPGTDPVGDAAALARWLREHSVG